MSDETLAELDRAGRRHTDAGRYDEAVATFTAALELRPGNPSLLYNRGEAYRRAGKLAEARFDLEAVLEIEGESADLLLALGLVAYESEDWALAIERYEASIALSPSPEAWNDLGVVHFRKGDYPRARAAFERAIGLRPDYGEAWFNLHDTLDELGLAADTRRAAAKLRELGIKPGAED